MKLNNDISIRIGKSKTHPVVIHITIPSCVEGIAGKYSPEKVRLELTAGQAACLQNQIKDKMMRRNSRKT